MAQGYDYVIVGGGSAGCALAARLSENPDARVCLIEAGGKDSNPLIHMPVGFAKMTQGPLTWGLVTEPQKHANDRQIVYAQARVLGGGSSINAEIYTRGHRSDYDRWARDEGAEGGAGHERRGAGEHRRAVGDRLEEPRQGERGQHRSAAEGTERPGDLGVAKAEAGLHDDHGVDDDHGAGRGH